MITILNRTGLPEPRIVKIVDRLPNPNQPVLWLDSTGLLDSREYSTLEEVKELLGFFYDSWIDIIPNTHHDRTEILNRLQVDIIEVRPNTFDIAPEREEINLK